MMSAAGSSLMLLQVWLRDPGRPDGAAGERGRWLAQGQRGAGQPEPGPGVHPGVPQSQAHAGALH